MLLIVRTDDHGQELVGGSTALAASAELGRPAQQMRLFRASFPSLHFNEAMHSRG